MGLADRAIGAFHRQEEAVYGAFLGRFQKMLVQAHEAWTRTFGEEEEQPASWEEVMRRWLRTEVDGLTFVYCPAEQEGDFQEYGGTIDWLRPSDSSLVTVKSLEHLGELLTNEGVEARHG